MNVDLHDSERLEFVLPIIDGSEDDAADHRTLLIAAALMIGKTGRDAIDFAMAADKAKH